MKKEIKEKKVLHKVKKNWVVIGMASVTLLGAGYVAAQNMILHLHQLLHMLMNKAAHIKLILIMYLLQLPMLMHLLKTLPRVNQLTMKFL
ncbi:hypothetical protein AKUH4B406M_14870 [Apilactobacillus kunkeei]|nr:hypothetical protein AKUH4B406M_14870 [Apilactobacillus kunkeei]